MLRRMLVMCVALAVCAHLQRESRGQAMAQSTPDDALLYVEWSNAEALGAAYQQSHLKAIVEQSQLRQLYTDFLPKLMQRIGKEEREFQPVAELINSVAGPMLKHPGAIYFGGVDASNPQQPMPRLALMIHAKGEAVALVTKVNTAVAKLGEMPFPVTAAEKDGVFVAVIGKMPAGGSTLAKSQKFNNAMGKLGKQPAAAMWAYVDAEGALAMVDDLVARYNANDVDEWQAAKAGLNLAGIQRVAYVGAFNGPDWADRMYIAAPAPRAGVTALLDSPQLGSDAMALVPQDATLAAVGRFDLLRAMKEVRDGVAKVDPRAAGEMDEALAGVTDMIGVDIETDLLDPMGDTWAFYTAPSVGGDGLMGFALINKLDDAGKVDQALWQLSQRANAAMASKMKGQMTLAFKQTDVSGLTVHYLAAPVVAPAWAIKDGNLYVGLYPQVVVGAANQVSAGGKGLALNAKYQDVRKRLNAPEGSGVQFIDMEARIPLGYSSWLALTRLYLGMADMWGVQSPAMVLPPLNVLTQHVSPAGAVTWNDAEGWHMSSIQPFPGSTSLATTDLSSGLIGQQALMISILLPSLNRSRETANRVKCASNMRQIGQATLMYANENRRKMPPDLGTLVKTQDIGADVFTCPSGDHDSVPAEIRAAQVDRQAEWVNQNAAYVWLVPPGLTFDIDPETVILHERDGNHDSDGMNLLYGDGHVEFQSMAVAQRDIEKSKQNLAAMAKKVGK